MTLFGSVCIFIRGELKYIDALFFASGAATQSGLNTVDLNLLNTWQQVVLFVIPIVTNPITINSFVVFLRLYWFEKRFQHIARESMRNRMSIAKTLTKARTQERDIGDEERGVNGRHITVDHASTRANGMTHTDAVPGNFDNEVQKEKTTALENARGSQSSESTRKDPNSEKAVESKQTLEDRQRPQIKFADQVKRSNGLADEPTRMPAQRSHEDHIAFLERQRNQDEGAVLRIPGPRDADAGVAPVTLDDQDQLSFVMSRRESGLSAHSFHREQNSTHHDDGDHPHPARRNITIAEPTRSPVIEKVAADAIAAKNTLNILRLRRPRIFGGKKKHDDHDHHARTTGTPNIVFTMSRNKDEDMPYLSWQPTVGRNSAFVDMTEEQREELGGIEYRSLKSLALILVAYYIGFTLLGLINFIPWILNQDHYGSVVEAAGARRIWWAFFTSNSSFTDLGFTLTPDSMISFQRAQWILVVMTFLIIIGNTGFPIMLRIIIWVTSKYVPKDSGIWEELKFLLDHPRRCFTLLFPSKATWWLFWILVILNGVDLVFFIILDVS